MSLWTNEGPRLYLTRDHSRVVPEGDPAAAFLFCGTGCQVPAAEAERYGLLAPQPEPAQEEPQPKGRRRPANKGA